MLKMKRTLLSIIIILCGFISYSQITLLHTSSNIFSPDEFVDGNFLYFNPHPAYAFDLVSERQNYYMTIEYIKGDGYTSYERCLKRVKLYNTDFQLVKEIVLPESLLFNNRRHFTEVFMMGKHIVNTDEKIELIVHIAQVESQNEAGGYDYSYSCYMINEDGDILYDFGDISPDRCVHKVGNQLRMIGWNYKASNPICNIYALGGTYNPSTMVISSQHSSYPNPYPNPSQNTIMLPYILQSGETTLLRIFNMNGQLMDTFRIGSDFDKIQINISNYPKGVYSYTYNGVTKKFIVQ
ncbi:MAG: T9SS type A sorting domain-containing protein [Bacteroidales bacterium]|nr:T9SS type A sorting domain-containing protein [Bacteroidales bacterium]